MMRSKIALAVASLLILSLAGSSLAAKIGGDGAKKELKKLQGTWVMVSG